MTFGTKAIITVCAQFHTFRKDNEQNFVMAIRDDRASRAYCDQPFAVHYMNNASDYAFMGVYSQRDFDKFDHIKYGTVIYGEHLFTTPDDAVFSLFVVTEKVVEYAGHAMVMGRVVGTRGSLSKLYVNLYPRKGKQYVEVQL